LLLSNALVFFEDLGFRNCASCLCGKGQKVLKVCLGYRSLGKKDIDGDEPERRIICRRLTTP
jgi:hypothetical protein